jgi:FMN phosphatase YigB (HAD superfamily)
MNCPPEEILYVGNNFFYDVLGASRAGMKTAWITTARRSRKMEKLRKRGLGLDRGRQLIPEAGFVFHDYRQLRDYVLM